jgi:ribosomal protein L12E/L44/L45/RPP1/RPP2
VSCDEELSGGLPELVDLLHVGRAEVRILHLLQVDRILSSSSSSAAAAAAAAAVAVAAAAEAPHTHERNRHEGSTV